MKISRLALATLVLLVPSLGLILNFTKNHQVGDKVVSIIDGDTFKLENNQTIRLASVDAPELEYCYGPESKRALSQLILNKRVILLEPYSDRYNRLVATVILDGQIVNEIMVRNGFVVDTYDNGSLKTALQDANGYARQNNLGVFSEQCSQVVPPNPNCLIKGNHDQRQNQKLYSYPGCTNYNRTIVGLFEGDQWFCSEKQAINNCYTKSGDCHTKYQFDYTLP